MFLVNYLNRTFTDNYFPLFEGIYSFELIIQFLSIILSGPVMYALWNTKYFHRNIRLRLVFTTLNALCAACARIAIIAHQIFGPTEHVDVWYLIVTSLFREYFKVYITGLALVQAFDRWIATITWSWYEKRAPSTISVFVGPEIVECSIALYAAYLLITEVITDQGIMLIYIAQLIVGVICYQFVKHYNINEMTKLKRGAQIESYSVSRSFQLRENLTIMRMLSKVCIPAALITVPCFVLYSIYSKIPANGGLDTLRYVSIAMYDVWISISFLSIMINLIRVEPKFRNTFLSLPLITRIRSKRVFPDHKRRVHKETVQDTNLYFSMLSNHWESGLHPVASGASTITAG